MTNCVKRVPWKSPCRRFDSIPFDLGLQTVPLLKAGGRRVYTKTKTRVVFLPAPALQVQEAKSKHAVALQTAIDQRERIIF